MIMNCIILDDEPKAIQVLERYVLKTPYLNNKGSFRSPLDALGYLKENPIDLVFLDISMPELTGMKIPAMLDKDTGVIFTTAYPEHAIEGFELNAIDYLLKPVLFERFLKAVNRANEIHTLKQQHKDRQLSYCREAEGGILFFKSGTQIHKTDTNDILYFEKEGMYFTIHLKNGKKLMVRTNFAGLMDILPANIFFRVHKSYIVSIKHIDIINNNEVMIGKTPVPLSESYKEAFMNVIKNRRTI
jgi:two-component system, LytTR family, response regulator